MLKKYYVNILLIFFTFITIFLHTYKPAVPCTNADDVSFGYNAYSIATTGKDEYGVSFPLRFKAFGENKLPVLAYLAAPFTRILGTTDLAIRLPLHLVGIMFPILMFALSLQLFKNKNIALITAFLTSVSSWIQITTRHGHEVPLATFFIVCGLIALLKYADTKKLSYLATFSFLNGIALFTYHLAKMMQPFLLGWLLFYTLFQKSNTKHHWKKVLLIFILPILFFVYTEYKNPSNRIGNLVFYQNEGFKQNILQKRIESNNPLFYNVATEGIQVLSKNYFTYLSPYYLSFVGDENPRFWYAEMGPITPVEYLFLLIGLYFLFKNNHKYKYFLLTFLLWSPLSAALSWAELSITRNFISIVPILLIVSYGIFAFIKGAPTKTSKLLILFVVGSVFVFFRVGTWDFYFNHYSKRPLVIRATECGYSELADYIKLNYDKFDRFYITKEHGQPYMHLLYQLQFPPEKYQSQATLSEPDKYGFGQVENFDKFVFHIPNELDEKKVVYIGYPWEIRSRPGFKSDIDEANIKTIRVGSEEIFTILER